MTPHEGWLKKSLNDLKSARKLVENIEPILDTAIYHTQQSAEKALKAYLAYCNQPVNKTHDLTMLNDLCVKLDPEFASLYEIIEEINPYDTLFRYPGEIMEPDFEDVVSAIDKAQKAYDFVSMKIFL